MLKKLSAFGLTGLFYLFIVRPSYAVINPCPEGRWSSLCRLNKDSLEGAIQNGLTILFVIATLLALFFLIFGGIKWITSGGDKANLEQARNWIVAAAVGLVITLLSYFIINIVLNFFGINGSHNLALPNLF